MDEIRAEVLQMIAQLDFRAVSAEEIAAVVGLDAERVEQIKQLEEFTVVRAQLVAEQANREEMLNRGWDLVEERALNGLLDQVEQIPDPDFLLKAAAMANKAERRNGSKPRVINGELNGHAVVQLPTMFVQHIQEGGFSIHTHGEPAAPKDVVSEPINGNGEPTKRFNALNPSEVEGLLGDSTVDDALANIEFSVALENG